LSSILKALKKLENEHPSSGADQSWLKAIDGKEAGFDRLKENWITHRRVYTILAVLLLVFAAVIPLNLKFGFLKTTSIPLISEKQQSIAVIPEPSLKNESRLSSGSEPAVNLKQILPEIARKESPKLPHARHARKESADVPINKSDMVLRPEPMTRAPALRQSAPRPAPTKSSKALPTSQPGSDTRTAEEKSTPRLPELSEPEQVVDAEILDDPEMKLQAISWSENTEKRLAVISGKIVRQGDRVGSYIVIQINKDDVAVRQGKELRKMVFRPR